MLIYVILQVKFEKGIQIVKIFKEHSSKTSILDDFGFYEAREKATQERKSKEQQFPKQVLVSSFSSMRNKFSHLTCFYKFFSALLLILTLLACFLTFCFFKKLFKALLES